MEGRHDDRLSFVSDTPAHASEFASIVAAIGAYRCDVVGRTDVEVEARADHRALISDNVDDDPASIFSLRLIDRCRRLGMPALSVVPDGYAGRSAVFAAGFRDMIGYPFIAAEIDARLAGLAAPEVARGRVDPTTVAAATRAPVGVATQRERLLVAATCRLLEQDIAVHHALPALARLMGSNHNSLSRAFNHVLGKGPYAWLRERRMQAAADLLTATDKTIQQISFDVGYDEPANFSTSFKNIHGVSPRAYRHRMIKS